MSFRSTLLFLCDRPEQYDVFLAQFRFAGFQLVIARNLAQASSLLQGRRVDGIVLRHNAVADDRPLASRFKRLVSRVPVFLLTDQSQPRPDDVDTIWRGDLGDPVVMRGMAMVFRQLLTSHIAQAGDSSRVVSSPVFPFAGILPETVS